MTLVELLVALALLSLVIALAGYGYAYFAGDWDKRLVRFERQLSELRAVDAVSAAVENAAPYAVLDDKGTAGLYFLGREQGLTAVTTQPVFAGGSAVFRLFREPQPDGRYQLVYEEAPLTGTRLLRADQVLNFNFRLAVLQDLESLSFSYLVVPATEEAPDSELPYWERAPKWVPEIDGMKDVQQPLALRIALGRDEVVLDLPGGGHVALFRAEALQ